MTTSPECADLPLRSAMVLNGIHRLLPVRGMAAINATGTSTPDLPSHWTSDPSRLTSVPRPVPRPLLTSARSAITSRSRPSARRHDSTADTRQTSPDKNDHFLVPVARVRGPLAPRTAAPETMAGCQISPAASRQSRTRHRDHLSRQFA
jgi:hypothetical protein